MRPIKDQTILITGATSGLGRELGEALAKQGATLLLHGRDVERGLETVRQIKETTGNDRIEFFCADFSSLVEVDELARSVMSRVTRLDVLVNNAGVGFGKDASKREISRDGYELRFAVNYLAYDPRVRLRLATLTEKLLAPKGVGSHAPAPIQENS